MQRRAELAEKQSAPKGSRWINGDAPLPTTYYAEARLDAIEDDAMIGKHQPQAAREPVYGAELVGANWSEDPVPTEPPRGEPLVIDGEAERIGEVNN